MAFSHLPGGLGHFADSNSIPQNQTATFHLVLIVALLLMHLLLLVERLFQRCHLSRIDEVLKRGDSMIKLHMLYQIPSVSCKDFVFARKRLNPVSGKILHHDSVPVIVSGFASLIECGEVEDVVSVLTPVCRGVAQVFHDFLVELRLLLVAEVEEKGEEDRQEESWEVESGEDQVEETTTWMTMVMESEVRTRLELEPM